MDVSILICTWNNSRHLVRTIESISCCTIPHNLKWELVIVNNNCSDDTDKILQMFIGKLPIVYVKEPEQGLSRARNRGLTKVSGKLLIFTDDDVTPSKEWLTAYWFAYQEKQGGFYFGGPIESRFETNCFDHELLKLAPPSVKGLDWGNEARELTEDEYFIGPNWACSSDALRLCGNFDIHKGLNPSLKRVNIGEETDLMFRLKSRGFLPWYVPQARIQHFVPKQKCTLRHISARWGAAGYAEAEDYVKGYLIYGIPRWLYKEASILWLRWWWSKIRGKKKYIRYCELKRSIGNMRGIYDKNKNKHNNINILLFWYFVYSGWIKLMNF